jgi:CubicO group peptidase (beta-lactamase class C family)
VCRLLATERGFARVDAVLRAACGTQFTGAVARIEQGGRLRFERAYGATRDDAGARPVALDTLFDLASITKPFVCTLALLMVARGRLDLDAALTGLLPEWRGKPHERITLRMLLAHNSGMNSGADYRELLDTNVVRFALERDLVAPPGERVIYSDLGFIVVGEILERLERRSLRALSRPALFVPPASIRASIPATEDDGWRGRVQGVVHDEKAYLMGGTAGHAGLFGSAADVAWLADQYLGPACGREKETLPDDLAREAISEQAFDPVLRRGLGWALKTSDENSCGKLLSRETFGHTGFVGTCIWADPARDCSGVLLTNAVYFGRKNIRDLRAVFYEAMVEDLGV